MKRKLVSVMTRYLADNPITLQTHTGDVRALAVLDGRIASVDDGHLIVQVPNTEDCGMGSELDSDLNFQDSPSITKINFPEKSHPQCLSFSTSGSYVGVLDYTGKLSVFNAHSGAVSTTYQVGTHGTAVALFSFASHGKDSGENWISVHHDRVMTIQRGIVSELCSQPGIVGARYFPDRQELCFVDKQTSVTTYSFAGEAPTRKGESIRLSETDVLGSASFSPKGDAVAGIAEYGKFGAVYDLNSAGTKQHTFNSPRPTARREDTSLLACSFSENGRQLWVSSEGGEIEVYDSGRGTKIGAIETETAQYEGDQPTPAAMMLTSPDGQLLFGCGNSVMATRLVPF